MIKKITTLLLLTFLLGCSADDNNRTQTEETITDKKEKSSSLFTLKTIEGKTIHIDETKGGLAFQEFKDKIVLFVFFGYRCPPCLREIPVLANLNNKNNKDLEIVALEVQGLDKQELKEFAKRKGINYHLISGEISRAFIDYIIQKANWQGSIPFLLGFNKKGVVQVVHTGGIGAKEFDKIYTALSKEDNTTK